MGIFEYGLSEGGLHPKKIKTGITNNVRRNSHKRHTCGTYFALCLFISSGAMPPLLHSPAPTTHTSTDFQLHQVSGDSGTFAFK